MHKTVCLLLYSHLLRPLISIILRAERRLKPPIRFDLFASIKRARSNYRLSLCEQQVNHAQCPRQFAVITLITGSALKQWPGRWMGLGDATETLVTRANVRLQGKRCSDGSRLITMQARDGEESHF